MRALGYVLTWTVIAIVVPFIVISTAVISGYRGMRMSVNCGSMLEYLKNGDLFDR